MRTWLITGCSSGFGRELAYRVLARGERVVATARRVELLEPLIAQFDDRALAVQLDLTCSDAIAAGVEQARARFGRLDVLVNNAGSGLMGTVEETPVEAAREIMEINYFGSVQMVKAVLPEMISRGAGHIVNVGSVAGQIGFPGIGYYSASKFALAGVTEALAAELAPLGIQVTLAELGPFRTAFTKAMKVAQPSARYDMAALSRDAGNSHWGAGEDPSEAAHALLSALDAPAPPRRLVLGKLGLEVVERHEARRADERAHWLQSTLLEG